MDFILVLIVLCIFSFSNMKSINIDIYYQQQKEQFKIP